MNRTLRITVSVVSICVAVLVAAALAYGIVSARTVGRNQADTEFDRLVNALRGIRTVDELRDPFLGERLVALYKGSKPLLEAMIADQSGMIVWRISSETSYLSQDNTTLTGPSMSTLVYTAQITGTLSLTALYTILPQTRVFSMLRTAMIVLGVYVILVIVFVIIAGFLWPERPGTPRQAEASARRPGAARTMQPSPGSAGQRPAPGAYGVRARTAPSVPADAASPGTASPGARPSPPSSPAGMPGSERGKDLSSSRPGPGAPLKTSQSEVIRLAERNTAGTPVTPAEDASRDIATPATAAMTATSATEAAAASAPPASSAARSDGIAGMNRVLPETVSAERQTESGEARVPAPGSGTVPAPVPIPGHASASRPADPAASSVDSLVPEPVPGAGDEADVPGSGIRLSRPAGYSQADRSLLSRIPSTADTARALAEFEESWRGAESASRSAPDTTSRQDRTTAPGADRSPVPPAASPSGMRPALVPGASSSGQTSGVAGEEPPVPAPAPAASIAPASPAPATPAAFRPSRDDGSPNFGLPAAESRADREAASASGNDAVGADIPSEYSLGLYSPISGLGLERNLPERLRTEMERANSEGGDVSLLSIVYEGLSAEDPVYPAFTTAIKDYFSIRDLAFESGPGGFALVLPNIDVRRALRLAEDLHESLRETIRIYGADAAESPVFMGISAAAGRQVPAARVVREAMAALGKARTDRDSHIVAYNPDPSRFRSRPARSAES